MTRIPRLRRLFALAAVLALTAVPLASARPLAAPAVHEADGGWLGTALQWVEDLVNLRGSNPAGPSRRRGQAVIPRKEGSGTNSGSCIDPVGRPRPCTS